MNHLDRMIIGTNEALINTSRELAILLKNIYMENRIAGDRDIAKLALKAYESTFYEATECIKQNEALKKGMKSGIVLGFFKNRGDI